MIAALCIALAVVACHRAWRGVSGRRRAARWPRWR